METIRQVVEVTSDRKLELTLPETVEPGLVEVVITVQTLPADSDRESQNAQISEGFGFLPKRVDPLEFQQQLRDEWNR